jgi:hypothetical protein
MKLFVSFLATLLLASHAFVQPQRKYEPSTRLFVSELDKVAREASDLVTKEPKVCVITGASQGLGQAMAYELVSHPVNQSVSQSDCITLTTPSTFWWLTDRN